MAFIEEIRAISNPIAETKKMLVQAEARILWENYVKPMIRESALRGKTVLYAPCEEEYNFKDETCLWNQWLRFLFEVGAIAQEEGFKVDRGGNIYW